jgi:hypothetical protein
MPILGIAQQNFGKNATWHYSYVENGFTGYKKISQSGDTNMFGMNWLRFKVGGLSQLRTGPGPNDLIIDTAATWPDIFLATRNDSVFRLSSQGPFLLYDFSANVGESWQYAPLDTNSGCPEMPIATVMAKGTEVIAGVSLDYFDVSIPMDTLTINGQSSYQISASSYLNQRIYPKLGALNYGSLFESKPNLCNGGSFSISDHNLRCYSDSNLFLNRSINNQVCDYWSLSLNTELELAELEVFPNPSHGRIFLKADQAISSISVLDLTGRIIRSYPKNETELELPVMNGMYLLQVILENGSRHLFKVQRL